MEKENKKLVICAQCGEVADTMEFCDLCRKPMCAKCLVEDYSGNVSDLQEPEIRHAICVAYFTPQRARGKGGR
ncbi:hypothetical protein [Thermogemmatispora sp.]|uniref:hypothetical protein n=1 Tax=Thermogemmatispora sp. TaxID=1968838 RepID=UPI0035E44F88